MCIVCGYCHAVYAKYKELPLEGGLLSFSYTCKFDPKWFVDQTPCERLKK